VKRPHRQRKDDRLMTPGASPEEIRCDFALGPLDTAARKYDAIWGTDRLPELVSVELAAKYGAAMALLNEAINAADPVQTAALAANCIKGLHAMDAEARALGHTPGAVECWLIEVEGRRFGFVRDTALAGLAKAAYPDAVIYTLRECIVGLCPELFGLNVVAVKQAFPGATVTAIRQRTQIEQDLDDEIPF
jgi:hypothetical protein